MRRSESSYRVGRWLVLISLLAVDAGAGRPAVVVGEVTARMAGATPETERSLRALVTRELADLELPSQRGPSYILSASLVRLDSRASAAGAEASCEVAATLRRAGSGAILAIIRGRGRAEDEPAAVEGARARALEAAVHGAVKRVPEAL
ncbi:MAG: hypothetical protein FJ104_04030 [Deltaproteobacteria bacterium]|nr:hypothetical protein [Deltaproteobacteria bacterium]